MSLDALTEDLAFSSVGQFRQNAISCFIRRKWRKDREAGRQAQRVLPVKFDEGEEEERRSSRRLRSDVCALEH